jgi:mRNA interferase HicA
VKRRDLERRLLQCGAEMVREGAGHTIYRNPRTGRLLAVPRHRDIPDLLAKKLIRDGCEDR